MKILIDTNVILDVLSDRKPFSEAAQKIFKLCEVKKLTGYISALSVPNIVYILRKELDAKRVQEILSHLTLLFDVADLKADDLKKAAALGFPDFEDALQSVCAARIKADYIITRNLKDFTGSKVIALRPDELLERI